jgi:hypothetical protein
MTPGVMSQPVRQPDAARHPAWPEPSTTMLVAARVIAPLALPSSLTVRVIVLVPEPAHLGPPSEVCVSPGGRAGCPPIGPGPVSLLAEVMVANAAPAPASAMTATAPPAVTCLVVKGIRTALLLPV